MILSVTIPPVFEYVGMVMDWFWPFVMSAATFWLGWIARGCEMPSKV